MKGFSKEVINSGKKYGRFFCTFLRYFDIVKDRDLDFVIDFYLLQTGRLARPQFESKTLFLLP